MLFRIARGFEGGELGQSSAFLLKGEVVLR
jgi:hypothetical protein